MANNDYRSVGVFLRKAMQEMIEILTPGDYVRHPEHPNWGLGQVQSVIRERITVNFENKGKQLINGRKISLLLVNINEENLS